MVFTQPRCPMSSNSNSSSSHRSSTSSNHISSRSLSRRLVACFRQLQMRILIPIQIRPPTAWLLIILTPPSNRVTVEAQCHHSTCKRKDSTSNPHSSDNSARVPLHRPGAAAERNNNIVYSGQTEKYRIQCLSIPLNNSPIYVATELENCRSGPGGSR
jgi:hypothetical protein